MITICLIWIIACIAMFLVHSKSFIHEYHGPWGIPLLGYYPLLRKDYHVQLTELSKKYGDAFLLPMAGKFYLLLSSYKALHETFVEKSNIFSRRSQEYSPLQYLFGDGLPYLNDEAWRAIRKFMAQCMKELSLRPNELKERIHKPLQSTIYALVESNGQPLDLNALLLTQCTEVVEKAMIGEVSKDLVSAFIRAYHISTSLLGNPCVLLCGNISRGLIVPFVKGYKEHLATKNEMYFILYQILQNHKENFNIDHPKDLIDYFLRERKIKEEINDPQAKYFTDEVLVGTLAQYFGDGGGTMGFVIASFLYELASRMDVQNMIYEEILDKIGTERMPTYEDRDKLPIILSVIKEIQRTSYSVMHIIPKHIENDCDTTISGVFIPKGTITLINAYAIHNDPNIFKDPESFDPLRFISSNEKLVNFGFGKRSCAGEPLIMAEAFLFIATILQRFSLRLEQNFSDTVEFEKPPLCIAIPRISQ